MSEWVPDHKANRCMSGSNCLSITSDSSLTTKKRGVLFNSFKRKHHCRLCGLVICNECSIGKVQISNKYVRACHLCISKSRNPNTRLSQKLSMLKSEREQLDKWTTKSGSIGDNLISYTFDKKTHTTLNTLPHATIKTNV